jgi:hypothetical protein
LLELQPEKLKDLEKAPKPFFKVYKYCQQGKDPEKVKLWTTDVCEEVEHAIDQQYCEMIPEERTTRRQKRLTKNVPLPDYNLPPSVNGGSRRRGIITLQRGYHGDVAFRIQNTLPVQLFFPAREKGKRIRLVRMPTGPGGFRRMQESQI